MSHGLDWELVKTFTNSIEASYAADYLRGEGFEVVAQKIVSRGGYQPIGESFAGLELYVSRGKREAAVETLDQAPPPVFEGFPEVADASRVATCELHAQPLDSFCTRCGIAACPACLEGYGSKSCDSCEEFERRSQQTTRKDRGQLRWVVIGIAVLMGLACYELLR